MVIKIWIFQKYNLSLSKNVTIERFSMKGERGSALFRQRNVSVVIIYFKLMDGKYFTACSSIKEALEIITNELHGSGERNKLTQRIGNSMYDKLCALGYITQGVTVALHKQGHPQRVRVWQLTNKPDLFKRMLDAPTAEERAVGEDLAGIMAFQG